eukprot:TRINITY_DN1233_c0_g1_i8.p1 TRINITY_DN1233_c0_g1~~TRINITY_DN1233_c0_g1_i8.p1  ORF type:complete len:175 (-),score=21.30 TRINITY_DN1233_c0_g1_i8:517-1041(-)
MNSSNPQSGKSNSKAENDNTQEQLKEDNQKGLKHDPSKEETKHKLKCYEGDAKPCPGHANLQAIGYYFNEEGKFRSIENGNICVTVDGIFKFTNQKAYDKMCDYIIEYIQQYLVLHLNMKEDWMPLAEDNEGVKGANNIFYTGKYLASDRCLLCKQKRVSSINSGDGRGAGRVL